MCYSSKDNCPQHLSPQLEERIPAAGAETHAIVADAKSAHTVVVTCEATHLFARARIPNIATEIVVTARARGCGRGIQGRE